MGFLDGLGKQLGITSSDDAGKLLASAITSAASSAGKSSTPTPGVTTSSNSQNTTTGGIQLFGMNLTMMELGIGGLFLAVLGFFVVPKLFKHKK